MRTTFISLLIMFFGGLLAGCDDDGPMEEMGESVDEAAEEVEDEVDDATS